MKVKSGSGIRTIFRTFLPGGNRRQARDGVKVERPQLSEDDDLDAVERGRRMFPEEGVDGLRERWEDRFGAGDPERKCRVWGLSCHAACASSAYEMRAPVVAPAPPLLSWCHWVVIRR